jgi:hypothetical protein
MKTVRDLLEKKGHQVWSVMPDTTVFDRANRYRGRYRNRNREQP